MTIRSLPKLSQQGLFRRPLRFLAKSAIENANKLIRQYFPKGTDFRLISDQQVIDVLYKLNRRPREKINVSTPVKEFYKLIP